MIHTLGGRNIDGVLPELLGGLLEHGSDVPSRVGDTKEFAFTGIMLAAPWQREITLPYRKANIAAQIAETMWVLAGRNDIEFLSHYLPRAKDFSDDGATWRAGYGPRLRRWPAYVNYKGQADINEPVDQLVEVVELLRAEPETRRAVMSIWDPAQDYTSSKDIPCNNWLHFLVRNGKLHLHVATRSNDAMWGWSGINAFEWSVLLEVVAGLTGHAVGNLHFSVSSMHLYAQHFERASNIANLTSEPLGGDDSPRFGGRLFGSLVNSVDEFDSLIRHWFAVESNIRNGDATQEMIDNFPEPMMRSWLRVLQWWWSHGELRYLEPLEGTRLANACKVAVQPKVAAPAPQLGARTIQPQAISATSPFIGYVVGLHDEKHKAYGDSWKRRGEMLGIMANIARKIDRLGVEGAGDTSTDTAVDLLVYLAKYRWWLVDHADSVAPAGQVSVKRGHTSDDTEAPNALLRRLDRQYSSTWPMALPKTKELEATLQLQFNTLERLCMQHNGNRADLVDEMLALAYELARQLWEAADERGELML